MSGNNLVVIKSFLNGLKLILDESADFEDILRELGKKCSDGRAFFGNATMAISIEGRKLSEVEEIRVLETIHINCNLNVICIIDHDENMNYKYIKAIKSMEKKFAEGNGDSVPGKNFFRGSLTDGMKLEVDYPIVILGDINPGCSIVSTGSIIVLGGLYGEAVIKKSLTEDDFVSEEYDDEESTGDVKPFIIALEMAPEYMAINDISYKPLVKPKWGIKHKIAPQLAYPKGNKMEIETVSKSVLETVYAL
ncbi:MAG: septum site-determining protein MinC [Lachnospiraceae bacterium]|nr:septum site-determining protein MinC [Lachnospiraceae bacterium]